MIREIVIFGDPVLRKKCDLVKDFSEDISSLVDDMLETMVSAEGIGLAAPQIGISQRVVIIRPDQFISDMGEEPLVMVNPMVELSGDKVRWEESCLSLPGVAPQPPLPPPPPALPTRASAHQPHRGPSPSLSTR